MKKILIDNKEIEISDESFEAFKKQLLKKDKRFVPAKGQEYWCVMSDGMSQRLSWINDEYDLFRLGQGNVFKTEEGAEEHAEYLKAISDVTNYIYENDLQVEPDWEDKDQRKYVIQHDHNGEPFFDNFRYCPVGFRCDTTQQTLSVLPFLKSFSAVSHLAYDKHKELNIIFKVE
jgi:hypothetical protein